MATGLHHQGLPAYGFPVIGKIQGVDIIPGSDRKMASISAEVGKYDETGEVWVALPAQKMRAPIDSLVTTPTGLRRVSEIDPSLADYANARLKWLGAFLAKITLPASVVKELSYGFKEVNQLWMSPIARKSASHPLKRPNMPDEEFRAQIDEARLRTIQLSYAVTNNK